MFVVIHGLGINLTWGAHQFISFKTSLLWNCKGRHLISKFHKNRRYETVTPLEVSTENVARFNELHHVRIDLTRCFRSAINFSPGSESGTSRFDQTLLLILRSLYWSKLLVNAEFSMSGSILFPKNSNNQIENIKSFNNVGSHFM